MSQVTEETTSPRLYKRGNDDIDLDTYIRNVEAEFEHWLAGSRLKDKQKLEIRDVYSKMIKGISDGTVNYKIGGGYNNSIGITNASKGFDAAGLVAGFLGNVLRTLDVYTTPEEKPDTSKTKYEGAKTIGNRGLSQLLGEAGNIQYFINLDELIDGKRGHSNRMKMLLDYINDIATEGNWDKYFTGYTLELKDQWFKDYEKYGKNIDINGNGILDENEYLGLSKLLGLNNIEQLFYTGQVYKTLSDTSPTDVTLPTYTDETEYLDDNHPRLSLAPTFSRSFKNNVQYDKNTVSILANVLNSLSKDLLFKLIGNGLLYLGIITNNPNNPKEGKELNYIPQIIKAFNGAPSFNNNYIIKGALELCRRKGWLKQFSTDANSYYIPFNSEKFDSKGTGLVYKISATGDHLLVEMDRRDIPFFTEQWHNDFVALIPSRKSGGTIRKFATGANILLSESYDWNKNIFSKFKSKLIELLEAIETNTSLTAELKTKLKLELVDDWNIMQERHYSIMGNWDRTSSIRPEDNSVFNYLKDIAEKYSFVNDAIGLSASDFKHVTNETLGLDKIGKWNPDNRGEGFTYARTLFGTTDTLKEDDPFWEELKKYGISHNTKEGFGNYNFLTMSTELPETKEEPDSEEEDEVVEKQIPKVEESIKTNSWLEHIPDLIGAGRLAASLRTNNKVYNTILPSLKPVLKDTYERYSPVTGAFSTMQLKNRQGADILRQASQPFTTDASLVSARMLEGQRQANQLQTEGFLADDLEIKRTKTEALSRVEDNMARRSEVANFNRASINQTNRERAQLKATKLKSNWQSWDNFLQGAESRLRTKFDENRTLANNFREQISINAALRWYNNVMEAPNKELNAWIDSETKRLGKTPDIVDWPKWKRYNRYRRDAENMMKAMLYRNMTKIDGVSYTSPYADLEYNTFSLTWI